MPPGTMSWNLIHQSCPGYEGSKTIQIDYHIPSGKKAGTHFSGTSRTAFIPFTKDGQFLLSMLAEAFRRKLTFKVGTSITTGQSNCVVWQGIHHKTSMHGGPTSFGYPDPTYFSRVKEELAARSLTEDMVGKEIPMENP
jgi:deltex-like protein